jgi:type IV pilus assembly protein PilV
MSRKRFSKGFTLLEVLIALLVFSIGLLGLAGMQLQGLKYSHSSYLRSQANLLAYDILDRMRSNRAEADAGTYNMSLGETFAATNCTGLVACSSTQMAIFDKFEWKQALSQRLPKGDGSVSIPNASVIPQVVLITVQWRDDKDDTNQLAVQQFTLRTVP